VNRITFLHDLLTTISDRGRGFLKPGPGQAGNADAMAELCRQLFSTRGEASGVAIAREVHHSLVAAARTINSSWFDSERAAHAHGLPMPLVAEYLLAAKNNDGRPLDPVARFHLGNGARLERINWLGDCSAKGLAQSAGITVNYLYGLKNIKANHEV